MGEMVTAALIAAFASLVSSVLTFVVGVRHVRRQVSTPGRIPIAQLFENRMDRLDGRLDRLDASLSEVRELLAFDRGRAASIPGWPQGPQRGVEPDR